MEVRSTSSLGALVRSTRRAQGLTQADLAGAMGVSRKWVMRLEAGSHRLEVGLVLAALSALGVRLDLTPPHRDADAEGSREDEEPNEDVRDDDDPFADVFDSLGTMRR